MVEHAPSLIPVLAGVFLVGAPALAILWATAFVICKMVYEEFFGD